MSPATLRIFIILFSLGIATGHAWAQDSGSNRNPQISGFIGNLLPNGVDGVDEITPLWGLRYSHPIGTNAFTEFGGIVGNSNSVEWRGGFVTLRMDIPVETLVAITYIGMDVTRYSGPGQSTTTTGGGHAGGGLMSMMGRGSWVRFDMKLNSKPGTSLYFALGLVFEWDSSGAGGAQ